MQPAGEPMGYLAPPTYKRSCALWYTIYRNYEAFKDASTKQNFSLTKSDVST